MNTQTIKEALAILNGIAADIEEMYIENGGEVTADTEILEGERAALAELVSTEGVDSLGRWLKAKEDRKAALKAEKDHLTREIAACDNTIAYIKELVGEVLRATGQDKVKGLNGYSFSQFTSVKTTVDKVTLESLYKDRLNEALFAAGLPDYIGATLTASVSVWKDTPDRPETDDAIFVTESVDTCKFSKPMASKEA